MRGLPPSLASVCTSWMQSAGCICHGPVTEPTTGKCFAKCGFGSDNTDDVLEDVPEIDEGVLQLEGFA